MIRITLVLIAAILFYLFMRANSGVTVSLTLFGHVTQPLSLSWLMLYVFLLGGLAHALIIMPERFHTWRALRKDRKRLRKMGKNLTAVIDTSKKAGK